jgi:ribosomal-protein-alanine N-acetyltransferase
MLSNIRMSLELRPLTLADMDELMVIEAGSYPFPWSRGNFVDSLSSGYRAQGLWKSDGGCEEPLAAAPTLVAYTWAMEGVEELHLLNLTVHPEHRRAGHARRLLDELVQWAVPRSLWWMWLEVRASNEAARRLYEGYGFEEAGLRRGYYPNVRSTREDAVLMRLDMRLVWERVHEAQPT